MERSSPSVQYQHFQLSKLPRDDVEKDATRNSRRKNCGRVEADVEPGLVLRQALLQRRARVHPVARRYSTPSQQGSNLTAQGAGKLASGGSNQNDAASSSQVWLSERAKKLAAAGTNKDPNFQERGRKLAAENSDINDEDDSKWPHNYRITRANVPHLMKRKTSM